MAGSTTIYRCDTTHRTRFILRHNNGAHSGYLLHLSVENACSAIRGVHEATSRQRADERLRRLRAADQPKGVIVSDDEGNHTCV